MQRKGNDYLILSFFEVSKTSCPAEPHSGPSWDLIPLKAEINDFNMLTVKAPNILDELL